MRVHVAFTPAEAAAGALGGATVAVVVDVLRATSTLTQALACGYRRVVCCVEVEEARVFAAQNGPAKLAGERHREHIEGFDFGNSPAEVAAAPVADTLVLTTSNGTRLLVGAAGRFEDVYVGSLLNLDAVAAAARASGGDVAVLCAGELGELALDDAYCAGRIAERLGGEPEDSAEAAIRLVRSFADAREGLGASVSAAKLRAKGLDADVDWCARESVLDVVPRFARTLGAAAEVVPQ